MENLELMTEETIPTEEATEQVETTETEEIPEESAEETVETPAETPPEETFSLRFNHEDVSVSKDEAIRLAQMGKHYEDNLKAMLDDLDYFCTLQGKSPAEMIKELVDGVEKDYREELVYQLGEDNEHIEELMELYRSKNRKNYESAKAERESKARAAEEEAQKSVSTRLAEQFESIRADFPEYDSIEKIPDVVFKRATKSGDLEKELLRFEKTERNKVEAAKASEAKNNNENIGSAISTPTEDNSVSAFMRGLWG